MPWKKIGGLDNATHKKMFDTLLNMQDIKWKAQMSYPDSESCAEEGGGSAIALSSYNSARIINTKDIPLLPNSYSRTFRAYPNITNSHEIKSQCSNKQNTIITIKNMARSIIIKRNHIRQPLHKDMYTDDGFQFMFKNLDSTEKLVLNFSIFGNNSEQTYQLNQTTTCI